MRDNGSVNTGLGDKLSAFWGSSVRATVRLIKNIIPRGISLIRRRIHEIKNRPQRKDISKVYVLVGYTTKKHVDDKFNAERRMIILRRGLLTLIFVLLMFIAVNRFISAVNYGELSQMFGFDSITDFVKNDPFSSSDKSITATADTQQLSSDINGTDESA